MSAKKQPKPSNIAEYKTGILAGLTFKQRRFAEYYVIEGNKAKAALKAGYSAKTASWQSRTLYNNPTVRAYIQYLIADQDEEIQASINEAKRRMSKALRGELTEQVVVTVKKEKQYYDKKGKKVIKKEEVPTIVDKTISMRDQIEGAKLYINIMDTPHIDALENQTTDDKILKAISKRLGSSDGQPNISGEIIFEEQQEDEEEQDNE